MTDFHDDVALCFKQHREFRQEIQAAREAIEPLLNEIEKEYGPNNWHLLSSTAIDAYTKAREFCFRANLARGKYE